MVVDPEVIPPSSSLGNDASSLYPRWSYSILFLILAIGLVLIVKTIFSSILIMLGLWFIWKQATKKLD